jgi:hypothetical protein
VNRPLADLVDQWEKAAAQVAAAFSRDPRTLALGAAALRTHLAWRRAFDATLEALWAPFSEPPADDGAENK